MALIGDVGTGKTILCRALLRELPKDVISALVLNPYLSDAELLGTILDDLGAERRGSTKGELMSALSQYLLAAGEEGKTVVVILDEAQQMSVEALEQVRILSTLETATRKLLQIVLAGQPELSAVLRRPELRQLDQRIGVRCDLHALSARDTYRYVEHRLRVAGLAGPLPFTRPALARVWEVTRGVPRLINVVADGALTAAFRAGTHEVTPAMVMAAARDRGDERRVRRGPARRLVPAAAALAGLDLAVGAAVVASRGHGAPPASAPRAAPPAPAVAAGDAAPPAVLAATPSVPPAPSPAPAAPEARAPAVRIASPGARALIGRLLGMWGVPAEVSGREEGDWPALADGVPDVAAIAARHRLAAIRLADLEIADLRAVGLPALVEVRDQSERRSYLVRAIDGDVVTLVAPGGDEARVTPGSLGASWTRAAWIVWRNPGGLPADPTRPMSAAGAAAVAASLVRLGHLEPPLPGPGDDRLAEAVRRFQNAAGLQADGIPGPLTVLALARATGAAPGA